MSIEDLRIIEDFVLWLGKAFLRTAATLVHKSVLKYVRIAKSDLTQLREQKGYYAEVL